MPKSDNLAIFLTLFFAFFMESAQTPFGGFYVGFAVLSIFIYFFSPLIYRSLNAFLAGFASWVILSVWEWYIFYFVIPYFLILSLILYVFAKK